MLIKIKTCRSHPPFGRSLWPVAPDTLLPEMNGNISKILQKIFFQLSTVSLNAIFSYSMKQLFLKFSSHSSSCCDSYWVTKVWWHLVEELKIVLWTNLTVTWFRFRFGWFIPPVIRMVTLYYVVILSFLNHLNLGNGTDKTGSEIH